MAPEQWNNGAIDARTDQWAFCATLYEVIAGVRPFSVENPALRTAEIETGRIAAPAQGRTVPVWLRKIIERGLRANPKDRWSSMEVVVDALVRGRQRKSRIIRASALSAGFAIVVASIGIVVAKRDSKPTLTEAERRAQAYTRMAFDDMRPGCSCPFSACEAGKCLSVCNAADFDYGKRVFVPGVNVEGVQEALVGVSLDEQTLLYLSGKMCDLDRLMVAHRVGPTFVPVDVTDRLDRTLVSVYEGCCTLAADGASALIVSPDHHRLVRVHLESMKHDVIELAAVLPSNDENVTLGFPVLSSDQLAVYFSVYDRTLGPNEKGPLDGIFASTRASTSQPFPPAKRMRAASDYSYVTGESSDHLTLFLAHEFMTRVLTRASRDAEYGAPYVGSMPARVAGWRAIPSADCSRLYTTSTPGGCRQEGIVTIPAVHTPPVVPYDPNAK
jgi:hypothetical protein